MNTGLICMGLAITTGIGCVIFNAYANKFWIDERGFHHDYDNAEGWLLMCFLFTLGFVCMAAGAFLAGLFG